MTMVHASYSGKFYGAATISHVNVSGGTPQFGGGTFYFYIYNPNSVLISQRKFEVTEDINLRVLEGEKTLEPEHSNTPRNISNRVLLLQDHGKDKEAEAMS